MAVAALGCAGERPGPVSLDEVPCDQLAGAVCLWASLGPDRVPSMIAQPADDVLMNVWEIAAVDVDAVVGGPHFFQWMSPTESFWRWEGVEVVGSEVFSAVYQGADGKLTPIPGKPGRVGLSGKYGFELDMQQGLAWTLWEGYTFEILPGSGDCHPPFGVLRTAYASDGTAYAADEFAIWRMDEEAKMARLIAGTPCVDFGPGIAPLGGPSVGAPVPMGNDHGYGTNVVVEPWLYITNVNWDVIARVDLDRKWIETWESPVPPFTIADIERGPRDRKSVV